MKEYIKDLNFIAFFMQTVGHAHNNKIVIYIATGLIALSLILLVYTFIRNKMRYKKYSFAILITLDLAYLVLFATGRL